MKHQTSTLTALGITTALLLAACGSSDDGGTSQDTSGTGTGSGSGSSVGSGIRGRTHDFTYGFPAAAGPRTRPTSPATAKMVTT